MTDQEKAIIKQLAQCDNTVRKEAIAICRKYLQCESVKNTSEMLFMREVDNVCPDLALRAMYRKKVLESPIGREKR